MEVECLLEENNHRNNGKFDDLTMIIFNRNICLFHSEIFTGEATLYGTTGNRLFKSNDTDLRNMGASSRSLLRNEEIFG